MSGIDRGGDKFVVDTGVVVSFSSLSLLSQNDLSNFSDEPRSNLSILDAAGSNDVTQFFNDALSSTESVEEIE